MHFFRALHDQICYDVTRDTTQSSPIILLLPGCRAPRPRPPAGRRETTTTTHDDDNRLARSADARTNTHALHRLLPIVASPRRSEAKRVVGTARRGGRRATSGEGDGRRRTRRDTRRTRESERRAKRAGARQAGGRTGRGDGRSSGAGDAGGGRRATRAGF